MNYYDSKGGHSGATSIGRCLRSSPHKTARGGVASRLIRCSLEHAGTDASPARSAPADAPAPRSLAVKELTLPDYDYDYDYPRRPVTTLNDSTITAPTAATVFLRTLAEHGVRAAF